MSKPKYNYNMRTIHRNDNTLDCIVVDTPIRYADIIKKQNELTQLGYISYFDDERRKHYKLTIDGFTNFVIFERITEFAAGNYKF